MRGQGQRGQGTCQDHSINILVLISVAVKKADKRQLGRKGFTWLTFPHHSPSLREVRARTQGRTVEAELKQRLRRNTAYWLNAPRLLACLCSPGPPAQGWHCLHQHQPGKCPTDVLSGQSLKRELLSQEVKLTELTLT